MIDFFEICPEGPAYKLAWQAISDRFPCIANLAGCPQEPEYHAEGDVWIHTRMVCEAMLADPAWRAAPRFDQVRMFTAALTHDIGKPACTREEEGRITSRGHSMLGAKMLRTLLWEQGMPFFEREALVNLVRFHQFPFYLAEREDAERTVIHISGLTRCDWLQQLATADINGRISDHVARALDNIELFQLTAEELGCREKAYPFIDPVTRYYYMRGKWHQTDYPAPIQHRGWVTLLAGLPGSGKDHWIQQHGENRPVVSLDRLRRAMGVKPDKHQGRVIQAAKEEAKTYLGEGRDFIWNATNITRSMRDKLYNLFHRYNYAVHLVYIEAPSPKTLDQQNRNREHVVPSAVLAKMRNKLEIPDPAECQRVSFVVCGD
ncbi:ATP-binding protein [Acanthopleuribacter pedis]|uniref:AAA family ATPase n=1 Tax=Acanthopleuribacter pedis TaxID=442870 RepID=A0A8J7QKH8_9BACT|nr:ATP-binding protein [Acanthopleuribacter pedis]MBO1321620.1 AAA family ATPase [Acanthopleuribacter pedis]